MEEFLLPIGIDATSFASELRQMKAAILELQNAAKQSGAIITQTFIEAGNATTKITSEAIKSAKAIQDEGVAAKNTATQFAGMLDQIIKVGAQNAKSFDINGIVKYFNNIKGGTVALTELIAKQNQTFDTSKVIAFNTQLQNSQGNFEDLKITLDFIKNNLSDLKLNPEGAQQLTQQITFLENALDTAATRASEIGINLNNPEATTALNAIQNEVSKTTVDFDSLNAVIEHAKEELKSIPQSAPEFQKLSDAVKSATLVLNENAQSIDQLKIKLQNLQTAKGATSDIASIVLLNHQIEETKSQIEGMDKAGSEGFDNLGKKIQTNATQATTLLVQYRNLRNEIGQLKLTDPTNPKLPILLTEAATLEKTIKNTNRELALASSNTAGFDAGIQAVQGIVGVFAAAQGAVALFGDKNEDLQKTLIKVTAAMSILQGVQQVGQLLSKESALNVYLESLFRTKNAVAAEGEAVAIGETAIAERLQAGASKEAAIGQEALNVAMEANPAGILLLAIGAIIVSYEVLSRIADKASDAQKAFNEVQEKSVDAIAKEEGELNILLATVKDKNLTDIERQNALDKINTSYPEYLHNLSLDNIYTQTSSDLITAQIELLKKRAFVQAAEDVYIEKLKAVVAAQVDLNRVQEQGTTFGEKTKEFFLGSSTIATKLKDVDDASKAADATLGVLQTGIEGVSHQLNESLPQFDNFLEKLNSVQSAAAQPIPFVAPSTVFNPEEFDAEKKAALQLAQSRVDLAVKGTTEEINARKNLLIKEHEFEQTDARILNDQKKAQQAKFLGELASLDNELSQKQLQNATAFAQARVLLTEEGSKEELNAKLKAIDAETREQVSAVGIQQGEILKIIAESEKKKQDLRRAFSVQQLQNEISLQNAIVSIAVDGGEEEFIAKRKILELQAQLEITNAKNNADKIREINAKLNDDLFDLLKSHNAAVAESGVNVLIDNIDAQLATVEKGTEEELKLLEDRNNKEEELQLIQLANSNKTAEEIQAERLKIQAEGNQKNLEAEKAFFEKRIDDELAFQQSLRAVTIAQQQNVVDDPLATGSDKREAQKKILQEELQDLTDQRAALTQKFLQFGGDRKKFETEYNNLIAESVKKRKELFDLDLNTFSFKGLFENIGSNIFKSINTGLTDPAKQQEAKDLFNKALGDTFSSLGSIFDSLTQQAEDNAQKQIDSIQRVIDATQEQITSQEDVVQRQQELSDKGLANDLRNQQRLLDDLKAKKAEEIKQREIAQKHLEQIQKRAAIIQSASVLASTVESGVNMILAATEIFKSFAKIPLGIGIPIAAAIVAGLFASFLSIKAAFSKAATEGTPKFREGGGYDPSTGTTEIQGRRLQGSSHEQRGLGLYDNRTGKEVAQYEGDEYLFAINKESTKKYLPLLEAINANDLPVRNTKEYRSLLNPDAARLPMEHVREIIILQKEVDSNKTYEILDRRELQNISNEIKSFHKTVNKIDTAKRIIEDHGDYLIITEQGRKRKVWKKRR